MNCRCAVLAAAVAWLIPLAAAAQQTTVTTPSSTTHGSGVNGDIAKWTGANTQTDSGIAAANVGQTNIADTWSGLQSLLGGVALPLTTNPTGSNLYLDSNGAFHVVNTHGDFQGIGACFSGDCTRAWDTAARGSGLQLSSSGQQPNLQINRNDYFNGGSGLDFGINEATAEGKGVNVKTAADFPSGSTNLTVVANANIAAGQKVFGSCIPTGDTVSTYSAGALVLVSAIVCDIPSGTMLGFPNASNSTAANSTTGLQGTVSSYTTQTGTAQASSGVAGYCFKYVSSGDECFGANFVARGFTGRKSSVSGSGLIATEFDLKASGPDDNLNRIGIENIFGENSPSADGATTFGWAMRIRPTAANAESALPAEALVGLGIQTMPAVPGSPNGDGVYGSFGDAFFCDGGESVGCYDIKSGAISFNPSASNSSGQPNLVFAYGTNINVGQSVSGSANLPANATVSAVYQCAPTQPLAGCSGATNETLVVLSGNLTGTIGTGVSLTFTGVLTDGSNFNGIFTDAFANWLNQLNGGVIKAGTALNTAATNVLDICGQGEDSTNTVICYGDIKYGITTNTHGSAVGFINLAPAGGGSVQINGSAIGASSIAFAQKIDVTDAPCSAAGDNVTDDSAAFNCAIDKANTAWAAGRRVVVWVPPPPVGGAYRLKTALHQFQGPGSVQCGDMPYSAYIAVDPTYPTGPVFSWDESWLASDWPGAGPAPGNPSTTKVGAYVGNCVLVGDLTSANTQDAFVFWDRNDFVTFQNSGVHYLNGSCLKVGYELNQTLSYMRESHFFGQFRCWSAGTSTHPAVDFYGTGTGDSTNNIHFDDLDVLNPGAGAKGVWFHSANPNKSLGIIDIKSLRIESGLCNGGDMLVFGDASDTGSVAHINIRGFKEAGVCGGQWGVKLDGASLALAPLLIDITGEGIVSGTTGGSGAGNGINIQAGNRNSFSFPISVPGIGVQVASTTKIATGSQSEHIDTHGNESSLTWNVNSTCDPNCIDTVVRWHGTSAGVSTAINNLEVQQYGSAPSLNVARAQGTVGSPTAVTNGQDIGTLGGRAYDGSSFVGPLWGLHGYAAENQSSGHGGTKACLRTTPVGSTTPADGACQDSNQNFLVTAASGITANSGGGQASATQLNADINRVTVVANLGDSVALPDATAGRCITIINNTSTNYIAVFGKNGTSDDINGGGSGVEFDQPAGNTTYRYCSGVAAHWNVSSPGPATSTTNDIATFQTATGKLKDSLKAIPSGTVVGTTDTQTLTNKTLTSPAITGSTTQGMVPYVNNSGVLTGLATGSQYQVLQTQGSGANPLWASPMQWFVAQTTATFTIGTQYFQPLTGFSTAAQTTQTASMIVGVAGTFGAVNGGQGNFHCHVATAPGTGFTDTCTLYFGATAKAATCNIADTATSCTDSSDTVAYTADTAVEIGFIANTGATTPGKVYSSVAFASP